MNGRVAVFQHPSSELDQLVVPMDGQDADAFAVLAGEVVRKLAGWEHRPAAEVLNDLLLPPADVLRFRTAGPETTTGTLPLEQTVQLLTGVRRLLSAVAHSVLAPQPYFSRLRRIEAEEFVGQCQVGQTERGSFTLTVACPLDLPPPGALRGDNAPAVAPFPRRVTELLMRSLEELVQAADLNRTDTLTDTARHPGVSANFCEALLLLRPAGDRSFLGVSSSWARVLPVADPPRRTRPEVELRQEAFAAAESLAPALRPDPSPQEDWYVGFVEELRGGIAVVEQGPSGEVWLSVYDDGEFIRARAYLTVAQYAIANAAHMTSALVRLKGVLRRLPRLREIGTITGFGLLHPNEGDPPPA
ncbi:MAG: hypothetical protein ACRC33_31745 [Gemmataceae bacterium]